MFQTNKEMICEKCYTMFNSLVCPCCGSWWDYKKGKNGWSTEGTKEKKGWSTEYKKETL